MNLAHIFYIALSPDHSRVVRLFFKDCGFFWCSQRAAFFIYTAKNLISHCRTPKGVLAFLQTAAFFGALSGWHFSFTPRRI